MKPRIRFLLLIASLLLLGCDSDSSNGDDIPDDDNNGITYTALAEQADFPVGVAIQASHLNNPQRTSVIEHAFSSITAEYEMKMSPISTGLGMYNWTGADALVSYAEAHGMQVHGHALLWHSATPSWIQNFTGNNAAFEEAIREYITAVVTRYANRVVSWDVVNEAFTDNSAVLRNTVFAQRMGPDYMARMFQYAHEADPDALLFYNDYGLTWDAAKLEAVLEMIDDFQSRGIPIDGVGLQMHVSVGFPDIQQITGAMTEIVSRGLKVHISELDVKVNPNGTEPGLTAALQEQQKARYRQIVSAFKALPSANRFAITVWGLSDPDSWLINFLGHPEWPLLFDGGFNPKPAYDGFLEALE